MISYNGKSEYVRADQLRAGDTVLGGERTVKATGINIHTHTRMLEVLWDNHVVDEYPPEQRIMIDRRKDGE